MTNTEHNRLLTLSVIENIVAPDLALIAVPVDLTLSRQLSIGASAESNRMTALAHSAWFGGLRLIVTKAL